MTRHMRPLLAALLVPALAVAAAACGGDEATSENTAQQADIDSLAARVQQNEVLFALKAIGDIPLHDMDEAIQDGTPGGDFLPNARLVIRYIGLTDWPAELESDVAAIEDAAIALVTALDEGDEEAAKQPSTDLHEQWHQFAPKAWAEIGADLPPEAGTSGGHGETTPAAGETPGGHSESGTPTDSH